LFAGDNRIAQSIAAAVAGLTLGSAATGSSLTLLSLPAHAPALGVKARAGGPSYARQET
jgi:hypothetical protein